MVHPIYGVNATKIFQNNGQATAEGLGQRTELWKDFQRSGHPDTRYVAGYLGKTSLPEVDRKGGLEHPAEHYEYIPGQTVTSLLHQGKLPEKGADMDALERLRLRLPASIANTSSVDKTKLFDVRNNRNFVRRSDFKYPDKEKADPSLQGTQSPGYLRDLEDQFRLVDFSLENRGRYSRADFVRNQSPPVPEGHFAKHEGDFARAVATDDPRWEKLPEEAANAKAYAGALRGFQLRGTRGY